MLGHILFRMTKWKETRSVFLNNMTIAELKQPFNIPHIIFPGTTYHSSCKIKCNIWCAVHITSCFYFISTFQYFCFINHLSTDNFLPSCIPLQPASFNVVSIRYQPKIHLMPPQDELLQSHI